MNPVFSNHTVSKKRAFSEALFQYQLRQINALYIAILIFIMLLSYKVLSQSTSEFLQLLLVAMIVVLPLYALSPLITADQIYKRNLELFQCELETEYNFYENQLVSNTWPSNATITIRYDQMKQIISTKHYFLLVVNHQTILIVSKESFSGIDTSEFVDFMRTKSLNAKFLL